MNSIINFFKKIKRHIVFFFTKNIDDLLGSHNSVKLIYVNKLNKVILVHVDYARPVESILVSDYFVESEDGVIVYKHNQLIEMFKSGEFEFVGKL